MSLVNDIKHIISFKLSPKDAIKYIEQKGYKLTFDYREMMHEAHHKAFTVAKITRLDLLSDIKESIVKAEKEGLSFQNWKKNIKPILIKKGWWGEVEVVNPKTGESKKIFVGNKRLKTIFYTNSRVAYQVAKAKKYYEDDNVVYLKYIAILDNKTRPSHRALHGTILPKNDSFWETHYPPNGWNCRCRVRAIPAHKKVTLTDKKTLPKNAVDPDWAYDVREGRFFDRFSEKDIENAKIKYQYNFEDFNLPKAKDIKKELLPKPPQRLKKTKDKKENLKILIDTILKDKEKTILSSPITKILIDKKLLEHIVNKDDVRGEFAEYIIPTFSNPDEIWAQAYKGEKDSYYKKRYRFIKYFNSQKDFTLCIAELKRDGSFFITFFRTNSPRKIDKKREGILMWFNKKLFGE